ncbi:MAG: M23 family metallopeptidase [Peptococcaceae bacterium]|nr:M23 family metallopeptidase [Peptococcaceae bacterium]
MTTRWILIASVDFPPPPLKWLFAFVEIIGTLPKQLQGLQQLFCMPYIYIAHGFRLPDKNSHQPALRYSLPFHGQWTVINGGVDKSTSHSWGLPTQRYAYDFVILDENGQSCSGDKTLLQNYYCYGKDVLAPADGIVVDVKDQLPDSRTYGNGSVDHAAKDIRGNYVVIRHADKEFSAMAHLLPRSVKVKVGQQVKRGECIAQCGNSGNTSEPHIHFQIQDIKSFFASAGLPISFQNIYVERARNYDKFDPRTAPERDENDASTIQRGYIVANMAFHEVNGTMDCE